MTSKTIMYLQESSKNAGIMNADLNVLETRKFKGRICCGGHLAVTYGSELLYLRIFSSLSLPSNFIKRMLPFLCGLKSRTHVGYHTVKLAATIMCTDHAEWLRQNGGTIIQELEIEAQKKKKKKTFGSEIPFIGTNFAPEIQEFDIQVHKMCLFCKLLNAI